MPFAQSIMSFFGFEVKAGKLGLAQQKVTGLTNRLRVATTQADRFRDGLNRVATGIKAVLGAVIVKKGFDFLITGYAKTADEAAKQSQAIGISIQQYQELAHVSQLAGSDIGVVSTGLQRMAKTARTAMQGSKTARKAFSDLGIDPKDKTLLNDQYALLLRTSDAIKAMPDSRRKTAIVQDLFGRSGARLIPLLNQGSKGIRKYAKEAHELGLVLDEKAAKQAEEYNDQLLRAKSVFLGVRNALAKELLPKLTDLLRRFQEWYRTGDNAKRVLQWIKVAALAAGAALAGLVAAKVIGGLRTLYSSALAGARALKALGTAGTLAHARLFLLAGLLLVIGLYIEDLYVFATGGESITGDWLGDTKEAEELKEILLDFGKAIMELWDTLKPALLDLWQAAKPLLRALWSAIKPLIPIFTEIAIAIITFVTKALTIIAKVLTWLISAGRTAINAIKIAWEKTTGALKAVWNGAKKIVLGVFNAIKKAGQAVWDGLVSGLKKAWNTITGFFKKIGTAAADAWDIVTGGKIEFIDKDLLKKIRAAQIGVAGVVTKGPAGLATNMTGLGGRRVTQQNSVGSVHVHVAGSTNMSETDLQSAVTTGLGNVFRDIYSDIKSFAEKI